MSEHNLELFEETFGYATSLKEQEILLFIERSKTQTGDYMWTWCGQRRPHWLITNGFHIYMKSTKMSKKTLDALYEEAKKDFVEVFNEFKSKLQ